LSKGKKRTFKEPQYDLLNQVKEEYGIARFGLMANESWARDPRRLVFMLARYKFVAKLFAGRRNVLEVGCADAFATRIVQQTVGKMTAVDFDPLFLADVRERADNKHWPLSTLQHDMLRGRVPGKFDAAFALDVLEHIEKKDEARFLRNLCASLAPTGIAILGMPSLASQPHASPQSKAGHVNCKDGDEFKRVMEQHFHTVFVFSMNDEVVHTGFYPMAHYLLAVCSHLKKVSKGP